MSLPGYDYTVNSRCVAVLLRAGRKASRLERFFSGLAAAPFSRGDYQERDGEGRPVEVALYEEWLVRFWTDHPAKKVHILDVEEIRGP